jgi:malate dehydrogenase (oxaloacetate-decarboxylating)(NADP+)
MDQLNPVLDIIGRKEGASLVTGMYIIMTKEGPLFFADCTVTKNPQTEQLIEITLQTINAVKQFHIKPRVAFASYSNFGSHPGKIPDMQREAIEILHRDYPDLVIDGEMQVNYALNNEILKEDFPFSKLVDGPANVLIFPYLTAGNIAYKLMQEVGKFEVIGPILNGLRKAVYIVQTGASVSEIVNLVTVAVIDAQCCAEK